MKTDVQSMTTTIGWQFDNSYARLPQVFYARLDPVPVDFPQLIILNRTLANELGLHFEAIPDRDAALMLSGNSLPEGAQPIAQAYAGHQFGQFTMLGDGRAILIGEHITPTGKRIDIQLKGSGQTPFSRRGDGRAALGPMLREYIISEAMHALGIPTTRSLAVVTTGETIMRETRLPGAILTRTAASHIRVGTFEYAARLGQIEQLKMLADYTIHRHYPESVQSDHPYLALLNQVIERQAALVAQWMLVGFIHGVMNTDNMAISGETIDYGPCAFMDGYDPATVFSSIDHHGRYSYENQPLAAHWNLARFAESLLPLLDSQQNQAIALAEEAIHTFPEKFQANWLKGMRQKMGLFNAEDLDSELIGDLLSWMQVNQADYTLFLRSLTQNHLNDAKLIQNPQFMTWHARWQDRLDRQQQSRDSALNLMRSHNPVIIPRNHRVEEVLAAAEHGDYSLLHQLLAAISDPYVDNPVFSHYTTPAPDSARIYQTFCGT